MMKRANLIETAHHEAGHAVAAYALGGHVERIVVQDHEGKTYDQFPVLRRRNGANRWEYHQDSMRLMHRASIVGSFAGPIAESRVAGDLPHVTGDVRNMLLNLARIALR